MIESMLDVFNLLKAYFWNIIIGFISLLIGFTIGIFAKKLSLKGLKEIGINKVLARVGIHYNIENIASSILSYLIYLITIIFVLRILGIASIVLYLLLGAILMLIVLSFIVGLKDVIPNLIAWIIIQRKEKIKVGRRIEVKEIKGIVEKIGYLETEIKTELDDILYVPNALFLRSKFWIKKD
ncbi:mechanosensitive ion channel [archaeon]|jgi:small-conductance mechanosensitive channel|nr:mechanosensitive ion channel [archaeon]MBT3463989.1 mechanosensitive ion channel [archaeon]MBT6868615.1 mechanosensitive ion channel [archaeon]MBT7193147.1 mechanosensitive ion channel [archaeon]MBT7381127.1 mechanosensitive ion channel [archaeon]